jgi:hypothetical protein
VPLLVTAALDRGRHGTRSLVNRILRVQARADAEPRSAVA